MKKNITLGVFILFYKLLLAQVFPVSQIIDNGPDEQRINFVVISEGYTMAQLPGFLVDAASLSNYLFTKTPFNEYYRFFNVHVIEVPSVESGADHPATANDEPSPPAPTALVNTYFNVTFDFNGLHRFLVIPGFLDLFFVLSNNYPAYDDAIVLVNSPMYGGSGGSIAAVTSLHSAAPEIVVHEIGHSFAQLADEYWAANTTERANGTAESDPSLVKWSNWVGTDGIGVYPHGSSGAASNFFRPHQNCQMRFLNRAFCAVCRERIIDRIYTLVDPIDSYSPASNDLTFTGSDLDFSLDLVLPEPNTLTIDWTLNGAPFATGAIAVALNASNLPLESNTLVATVTDTTAMSRSYLPTSGYVFSTSWTISTLVLPIDLVSFHATAKETYVSLDWVTNTEINVEKYDIERSANAIQFEKIAELFVPQNTIERREHSIIDPSPLEGKSYYRLKIINKDGTFQYSPIRSVNRIEKFFFKIYPNPTYDQVYLDYFINSFEENFTIELYNKAGQQLQLIETDGSPGRHQLIVDLAQYPNGMYFLQINERNYMKRLEIIKQ